jgi:Type IV secretion system pilin
MNCTPTDLGCIPNDPAGFVAKFYGIGLGLIGGVAVLFIIYGGYIILSSQGNPQNLNRGKSYIMYAIIGLLLAIFGFVFIQIIAVNVLGIPGFK